MNYRPISLLSSVSKALERFVHTQLLSHCFEIEAISDRQFGFLLKHSTTWQLLDLLEDWEKTLDKRGFIRVCFLDIAKAFDRINHNLLLQETR